ncbi:MAG: NADH-quinone oxidoreductase subunit C [Caldilineaceae bacterium]|nr:NADH-quinone oxidoreductase subunit C [Caldilineaceae bacterium]
MSEATAVATAPAVDSSLPYNDAVPGAVVGTWADDTEKALFVAPDKLIDLLTHLRDKEQYDLLANLTCVDYQAYKGKARAGISERFDVVYHLYSTAKGGGPCAPARARAPEGDTIAPATSVYPGATLAGSARSTILRHHL